MNLLKNALNDATTCQGNVWSVYDWNTNRKPQNIFRTILVDSCQILCGTFCSNNFHWMHGNIREIFIFRRDFGLFVLIINYDAVIAMRFWFFFLLANANNGICNSSTLNYAINISILVAILLCIAMLNIQGIFLVHNSIKSKLCVHESAMHKIYSQKPITSKLV